jgi:hypothetical protein
MKDIAGKEGEQQKALDSVGIVLVNMVGMPTLDRFVEPVILDIPTLVTKTDGPFGGDGLDRKGSHPDPVTGSYIVLSIELSPN